MCCLSVFVSNSAKTSRFLLFFGVLSGFFVCVCRGVCRGSGRGVGRGVG